MRQEYRRLSIFVWWITKVESEEILIENIVFGWYYVGYVCVVCQEDAPGIEISEPRMSLYFRVPCIRLSCVTPEWALLFSCYKCLCVYIL